MTHYTYVLYMKPPTQFVPGAEFLTDADDIVQPAPAGALFNGTQEANQAGHDACYGMNGKCDFWDVVPVCDPADGASSVPGFGDK